MTKESIPQQAPDTADIVAVRLVVVVLRAIAEILFPRVVSIVLRGRPVVVGCEIFPHFKHLQRPDYIMKDLLTINASFFALTLTLSRSFLTGEGTILKTFIEV